MKFLITTIAIFYSLATFSQSLSNNSILEEKVDAKMIYHKAKIFYGSSIGLTQLASQGIPLDHVKHKKGIYIESDFSENDLGVAKMLGMKVEIVINDVSKFYVEQNNKNDNETKI